MKAEATSLTFLGSEGSVKIPFFQRGYVWDKTNWEDLLTDLLDIKKNVFLGSLILKQQIAQTGKPKEVLVIDGQQRLTTLSILLRALYDSFDNETKTYSESTLSAYLYYKKTPTSKERLVKIQHSKVDSSNYCKVIEGKLTNDEIDNIVVGDIAGKIKSKGSKILQCYKFFIEEFKKKTSTEKVELFDRLLDINNKILVVIDLSEKEDEQSIFDTINSAGVRLSGADIIKNAIYQKAIDLSGNEDTVLKIYEEKWENIFTKDDETIQFWETPRVTGRLIRDNIEILLHSIAVIKGFFDPDKHTLSDISSLYKDYIDTLDWEKLQSFINEIADYANLYREKILVFNFSTLFSYSDSNQRLFHILNKCDISTFHPYILFQYYKYKNNKTKIVSNLKKLESLIVKKMIIRDETKSYNKMCKEFIQNESSIDSKLSEISDQQVYDGLCNIYNKNAALLLFWVELWRRENDKMESLKELKYSYSLEHVMPQKWEAHWSNIDFVDESGTVIPASEDTKIKRTSKIYSIGNMTLLNTSLNTSLKNYDFERKINGESRKKGIRTYSDLSITKNDILIPFDSGSKIWNEKSITDRTSKLYQEILQIW